MSDTQPVTPEELASLCDMAQQYRQLSSPPARSWAPAYTPRDIMYFRQNPSILGAIALTLHDIAAFKAPDIALLAACTPALHQTRYEAMLAIHSATDQWQGEQLLLHMRKSGITQEKGVLTPLLFKLSATPEDELTAMLQQLKQQKLNDKVLIDNLENYRIETPPTPPKPQEEEGEAMELVLELRPSSTQTAEAGTDETHQQNRQKELEEKSREWQRNAFRLLLETMKDREEKAREQDAEKGKDTSYQPNLERWRTLGRGRDSPDRDQGIDI